MNVTFVTKSGIVLQLQSDVLVSSPWAYDLKTLLGGDPDSLRRRRPVGDQNDGKVSRPKPDAPKRADGRARARPRTETILRAGCGADRVAVPSAGWLGGDAIR